VSASTDSDNPRRLVVAALVLLAALGASACKKKPKPFPPATPLSSASTEGATLVPVPVDVATAAPADTLSASDRAALEQAKITVAELEGLVKLHVITNPDKPDDIDATAKCAALEPSLPQLEGIDDPEATKAAGDAKRLCSLEVPLLGAEQALKQLVLSPSQASRKLMCGFASKDIGKARRASPGDRRVRDLDARYARACR
jgi:hypothetical protein